MVTLQTRDALNTRTKTIHKALFVTIDPANLTHLSRVRSLPKRYYVPRLKEWEVPLRYLNEVVLLFQDEEVRAMGEFTKAQLDKINQVSKFTRTIVSPSDHEWKTKPFKHQETGFIYGMNHNKFINADEMGLGKSKQCADLAVARKSQFKHCLIICCVNGLKYNWVNEIKRHTNEKCRILGAHVGKRTNNWVEGSNADKLHDLQRTDIDEFFLITNIETLRDKNIQKQLEKMTNDGTIGMCVVDEWHRALKNPMSTTGKSIHCVRSFYKVALTGTPVVNNPLDFYNVLKWLDIEKHTWTQFQSQYCETGLGFQITGYKNMPHLRDLVSRHMLRRKKEESLDLPPKIPHYEYVELLPKQKSVYNEVLTQVVSDIDKIALLPNPLSQLTRLRQVTAAPEIISSTVNESAKMNRLIELVDEVVESGGKAVIFSNWTEVVKVVLARLKPEYQAAWCYGSNVVKRKEQIDRFQDDPNCRVVVGTIDTLGTGYTLTAAQDAFFIDSPWHPAAKEQAEDRLHRIGTIGTVNITTLVTVNTVDQRVEEIIKEKQDIADYLVDGKVTPANRAELLRRLIS